MNSWTNVLKLIAHSRLRSEVCFLRQRGETGVSIASQVLSDQASDVAIMNAASLLVVLRGARVAWAPLLSFS